MTSATSTDSAKCKRCKGSRQIEDDGVIYSCPDCEGTGENFDMTDDEIEYIHDIKSGKD